MCGFAGFVGTPDSELLQRMGLSVRHRGPDGNENYSDGACSLVHYRLSIIDLSTAGRQPMKTADGRFVIAYNGEIYNYRELRKQYESEGWKFESRTDTECFLASAALHNLHDLDQFHGIFSFVLWDSKEHVCYVARDRMGIKPLFISTQNGRIAFASEIQALLHLKEKWKIDSVARSMYLSVGYVPGPRTIYEGIQSLESGRRYVITDGKLCDEGAFYKNSNTQSGLSQSDAKNALVQIVDKAVSNQLVSDRPVGVFLSGGLDSSVVLSSMRSAQPNGEIKTFTTRFKHDTADPKFNRDADLAKLTAKKYGCDHHEVTIDERNVIENAELVAYSLGQPHNNHSTVALDAAVMLARKDVVVVLSGDGGDESFGGYDRYKFYKRVSSLFRNSIGRAILGIHPRSRTWLKNLSANDEAGAMLSFHATPLLDRKVLFGEAANDDPILEDLRNRLNGIVSHDRVARFMELDRETWLRDDAFVRSDRLTMRCGLELRVPLTDDSIVEFAASLPSDYHVTYGKTKALWRDAFADRCLPEVVSEQKRGWFPPTSKWLRAGLKEWAREILEEAIATHQWINGTALRNAWEEHQSSRVYRLQEIWTVIAYHLWWRANGHKIYDV